LIVPRLSCPTKISKLLILLVLKIRWSGSFVRYAGTHVVSALPDGESAVMRCAARLRHIAGKKWGTRRYLNIDTIEQLTQEPGPATV
jgi:hypothetical protein